MDTGREAGTRSGRGKVGLKEIAREAEVSISTVSHVMNGTARISEEVRGRVMRIAQDMGYLTRRRDQADTVALRKLLLAVPAYGMAESEANLFLWSILSALRSYCEEANITVVPFSPSGETLTADGITEAVAANGCDAILLMHDDRPELLRALSERRADLPPIVLVNGEDPEMEIDTVSPQNRFAAQKAVRWLTRLGHHNILHVTWHGRTTIDRRRDGFLDAMAELGIARETAPMISFPSWDLALAERLLSEQLVDRVRDEGITAIFCAADNVALHARGVLHRAGLKVPDDVSLLGFDNLMHADMSSPPLSSVEVPVAHVGPTAVRLLKERLIEPRESETPARRIELACRIVQRASVASPRGRSE